MRIYISRRIPAIGKETLEAGGHSVTEYSAKKELTKEELIDQCREHDALLSVGGNQLDEHFFSSCAHLKGVALLSVGYDQVDLTAASRWKIPVSNTPGVLSQATSDTAFLLMLAVSRKAFYASNSISRGDWGFYEPTANLGQELYGKTLGIFGLGKIGFEMAKKSKYAFGMKIIYHNRKPSPLAAEIDAAYVSYEQLLEQADVLSLHTDLNPATMGLFNKTAFEKMKPTAIFINTARGKMHNEKDLTEALLTGEIWGAGLDVTNPEPMAKDNLLLNMPNVCVLPHIGSATVETRNKMAEMAAENLLAALAGKPMPQQLNAF